MDKYEHSTRQYKTTDTSPRTPQGTMWYRQSPGPTKNKNKLNKHKHCQEATWNS